MRSIRKTTSAIEAAAVAIAIALIFPYGMTGCAGDLAAPIAIGSQSDETPKRGGALHLASFGDLRNLDPAVSGDALSTAAIRLLFAGLVEFDAEANVVGDLAERFEIDAEGTTYRFFLRPGIRFHDGDELTADDVKRSIERALHPNTPGPLASIYERIAGFDAYRTKGAEHLEGVVVEGRYVVAIHLRERDATFLRVLALAPLRVVCKDAGSRYTDGWAPCGAGPFKLLPGGWDHGRSLTVVRHEGYFKPGLPYLDSVTWSYSMAIITERFKFERGDIDLIHDLTQPDAVRFQQDARWKPFGEYESDRIINGEAMNTEMPPFDNVEIRRAVASAIDRDHLVMTKRSSLRAASQAIPPGVPGYDPDVRGQSYDYAAALEHMRKAGYPFDPKTGEGGWPAPVPYVFFKQGLSEFSGQIVQQELAKIGIRLELKMLSFPTYMSLSRRRGKSPISPQSWTMDYPDPSSFLDTMFTIEAINDEDSNNPSFYKNPSLDGILTRARQELEPSKRRALYAEASQIVCDDAPWAFTFSYRFYDVHQPYVRGYRVHPVWSTDVGRVWIDRAAARMAAGNSGDPRRLLGGILGSVLGDPPR